MWGWGLWVAIAGSGPLYAAAPPALQACCDAADAGMCPDELTAIGPGSQQQVSPDGTTVTGLWRLSCETGARFDPNATQVTARPLPPASILTPMLPAASACFEQTCRVPEGSCLRLDGSRLKLAVCADGSDAPEAMWRARPRAAGRAVVVGGRVLQPGADPAAPGPTVQDARVATTRPQAQPQDVDPTVPDAAPDPCRANPALRDASNQQVDEGNEAMVGRELGLALDKYRAAISINSCNAFAWAALGDALLQSGYPAQARTSLEVATRLMPTNVHAWTTLGLSREQGGDRPGAAEAFRAALEQRPGHTPAAQGLQRVQ